MITIPRDMPEFPATRGTDLEKISLERLLKRPEVSLHDFRRHGLLPGAPHVVETEAEVEVKYEGYIERQKGEIARLKELEGLKIPPGFDYYSLPGLSKELKVRLTDIRPATMGQAAQLEGMTPAGLQSIQLGIRVLKQ